jgi:hypothetical protein
MMSNLVPKLAPRRGRTAFPGWLAVAVVLLLGWLAAPAPVRADGFAVSLDRNTVSVGESVTLTMTFQGGSIRGLPAFPQIPNLDFSGSQGESSEMTIINGAVSSSESYTFTVTPSQPGEYTIPAMTVEINGAPQQSKPVKLTVLKGAAAPATGDAPAPNGGAGQLAFIRLLVPKQKVYVGEVIEAHFQLFLRNGVVGAQNFDLGSIPAEGFTIGKTKEGQRAQTELNGVPYTIVPITMIFTAVKTGTLALGPLNCNLDLLLGPMDFFGRPTRSQHATLTNDVIKIESLPLPRENVPPGFSGAVGDYHLSLAASPTNVAVGDPITLTLQVSGRGEVDSITLPDQTNWDGFKIYPPTSDFQPGDDLGLTGTRTFKLTVVPQSMDAHELPPYEFAYFDPDKASYQAIKEPAVPLIIRPSAASLPPPSLPGALTSSDVPATNTDILHIKVYLGAVGQIEPPLIVRPWFLAVQAAPVVAWLALLVRRRHGERLAANPRLRRQRQADRAIRDGLNELRRDATAGDHEHFFATVFRLLQERLGERLDLPASAITEAVVEERLRPLKVADSTLASVRELFQTCDQARYSRQSTNEELMSVTARLESTLVALKELKP